MATRGARVRVRVAPGADRLVGLALQKVVIELCNDVQAGARRIVPWLSGDLHDSIEVEVEEAPGGAMVGRVGSNLPYALAVEYGRPDVPAYPKQPYLGPALYQVRGRK